MLENNATSVLKPLKLSCDNSDCANNLHCFRTSKSKYPQLFPEGNCNVCGASLVNWERLHLQSPKDIEYTISSLKKEWIRHYFWHEELNQRAKNYALRKGKANLVIAVSKRLENALKPIKPFHDGFQTPFKSNNPIFYAQHATATCCRHCLSYWHGIPEGRELTSDEVKYCSNLLSEYLNIKIPNLTNEGEKIAPIRGNIYGEND